MEKRLHWFVASSAGQEEVQFSSIYLLSSRQSALSVSIYHYIYPAIT